MKLLSHLKNEEHLQPEFGHLDQQNNLEFRLHFQFLFASKIYVDYKFLELILILITALNCKLD